MLNEEVFTGIVLVIDMTVYESVPQGCAVLFEHRFVLPAPVVTQMCPTSLGSGRFVSLVAAIYANVRNIRVFVSSASMTQLDFALYDRN